MTQYLNPPGMTKEAFLAKYGTQIEEIALKDLPLEDRSETCIVVWVNNGAFSAAGIMDGERDFRDFTDPDDPRPKKFFRVKTTAINAMGGVDGGVVR